jgi:single-strand DNA-binding protein
MNGLHCAFTGRLGGDPEMKYTQAGKPLLNFSVAVDQNTTATEDRPMPETTWCRVTCWDDMAVTLADQLHKGSAVYCEGKLKLDRWEKDGEPRAGLSVSAWRCEIHGALGKQAPKREPAPAAAGGWPGWPGPAGG